MIDLDWLDEQLEQALSEEVRCARHGLPAPARTRPASRSRRPPVAVGPASPPPAGPVEAAGTPLAPVDGLLDVTGHARRVQDLVRLGRLHEADLHIAAHAFLAGQSGTTADRRDAAAWATMRALVDGREADARAGAEQVLALGRETGDPDAWLRYLVLRYRVLLEWGSEEEHDELLDHCRARAYWFDELAWRGALTLLLARVGKRDEAAREFDLTTSRVRASGPLGLGTDACLDVTTDLAEAAAVLGDAGRAATAARSSGWPATGMVVSGRADVCKGPIAHFRALAAMAAGEREQADRYFRAAAEAIRGMGAPLLLARVLGEWGNSLAGRDDSRASAFLEESAALARAG